MRVAFNGTQEIVLSFEAGTVTNHYPVVMSQNNEVSNASDGDKAIGIALFSSNGIASVQMKGYIELPYTGTTPTLGFNSFLADGTGGIKSDPSGIPYLVVNLDTTNGIVGLYL